MYLDMSKQCLDTFVMPMVLSVASLHSLGNKYQNEMKHDFLSHLIHLLIALLSHDANSIINGIILFH